MGNKKVIQSVILVVILLIVSLLAYRTPGSVEGNKRHDLTTILGPVPGYKITSENPLDESIYKFLELDDYTSIGYEKDGVSIGLYIGYYYGLDKVSAAHSPLVCFPGQGWTIDQPAKHSLEVGEHTVNYAEMVASLGGNHELVLYWYQADDSTSTDVYRNKINAMVNKIARGRQEHAFVRVTIPFVLADKDNARQTGIEFIQAFYPTFLSYINN